ncbi:NADH-quinone oxidoreductase subunit L [Pasteuria penetrans]|uniref:NADH-quinone oxidoreductase subunit 5 family protein n=1 Tax=Pasteuria penetrans TaxID=86005 RepID=UPI000FB2A05B|nr:proton-conducting transporter membrane subunit [Pasteuria penetrans]
MSAPMVGTIVALPLLVPLLFLLMGAKLARGVAAGAGVFSAVGSAVLVTWLAWQYGPSLSVWKAKMPWFQIGHHSVDLGFLIRPTTLWLLLVVAWISVFVHGYAWSYMKNKSGVGSRFVGFFALLGFFTASMQSFVVSSNFLQLVMGWEALGVASFLLIGFWQEEQKARRAAIKAFLMTRLGDMGLLAALGLTWWYWKTWEIDVLAQLVDGGALAGSSVTLVALLVAVAALAKAGQMPLHTWLPDAMVGPTPVSAFLHAATMVVAGVYLVDQFSFLFSSGDMANMVLLWAGAVTAIYASFMACLQTDLKRLLAYSTASHLGFMFAAMGLQMPGYAFLLLCAHASFKALLFLIVGVLLSSQRLKGAWTMSTGMLFTWVVGVLAMCDFPSLKKDILAAAFSQGASLSFYLLLGAYAFTFGYVFRLGLQVRRVSASTISSGGKVNLPGNSMGWSIVALTGVVGLVQGVLIAYKGGLFHWLEARPNSRLPFAYPPSWWTPAMVVLGLGLAVCFVRILGKKQSWWWEDRDPWDAVYRVVVVGPVRGLARGLLCFDQFVIHGAVHFVSRASMGLGRCAVGWQRGRLERYLLVAVLALAVSLLLLLWIGIGG